MMSVPLEPGVPPVLALARAVPKVPTPDALPGGCLYEPKWDGYLHRTVRAEDYGTPITAQYVSFDQMRRGTAVHPQVDGFELTPSGSTRPQVDDLNAASSSPQTFPIGRFIVAFKRKA